MPGNPSIEILQPISWPRPSGHAAGVAAEGRLVFTAQVGWTPAGVFEARDLPGQVRQALRNVTVVIAEAGGVPSDLVKLTWFVRDIQAYRSSRKEIGAAYREVIGRHYPSMALVQVELVDAEALVELEAVAVVAADS